MNVSDGGRNARLKQELFDLAYALLVVGSIASSAFYLSFALVRSL